MRIVLRSLCLAFLLTVIRVILIVLRHDPFTTVRTGVVRGKPWFYAFVMEPVITWQYGDFFANVHLADADTTLRLARITEIFLSYRSSGQGFDCLIGRSRWSLFSCVLLR